MILTCTNSSGDYDIPGRLEDLVGRHHALGEWHQQRSPPKVRIRLSIAEATPTVPKVREQFGRILPDLVYRYG